MSTGLSSRGVITELQRGRDTHHRPLQDHYRATTGPFCGGASNQCNGYVIRNGAVVRSAWALLDPMISFSFHSGPRLFVRVRCNFRLEIEN